MLIILKMRKQPKSDVSFAAYLYNIIKIQPARAIVTKHRGRHLFDFLSF